MDTIRAVFVVKVGKHTARGTEQVKHVRLENDYTGTINYSVSINASINSLARHVDLDVMEIAKIY